MKGINEHILDFEILETKNTKTLVFVDSSEYMENPEKPLLEIVLPGTNRYVLVNISPRKINTFTSNTLGLTQQVLADCQITDLPDGVYTLKYKICPYRYINRTKYFLRTTALLKKLTKVLDDLDLSDCTISSDRDLRNEIADIFILIESARASAELANTDRASSKYQLADKKITKILQSLNKK